MNIEHEEVCLLVGDAVSLHPVYGVRSVVSGSDIYEWTSPSFDEDLSNFGQPGPFNTTILFGRGDITPLNYGNRVLRAYLLPHKLDYESIPAQCRGQKKDFKEKRIHEIERILGLQFEKKEEISPTKDELQRKLTMDRINIRRKEHKVRAFLTKTASTNDDNLGLVCQHMVRLHRSTPGSSPSSFMAGMKSLGLILFEKSPGTTEWMELTDEFAHVILRGVGRDFTLQEPANESLNSQAHENIFQQSSDHPKQNIPHMSALAQQMEQWSFRDTGPASDTLGRRSSVTRHASDERLLLSARKRSMSVYTCPANYQASGSASFNGSREKPSLILQSRFHCSHPHSSEMTALQTIKNSDGCAGIKFRHNQSSSSLSRSLSGQGSSTNKTMAMSPGLSRMSGISGATTSSQSASSMLTSFSASMFDEPVSQTVGSHTGSSHSSKMATSQTISSSAGRVGSCHSGISLSLSVSSQGSLSVSGLSGSPKSPKAGRLPPYVVQAHLRRSPPLSEFMEGLLGIDNDWEVLGIDL